LYIGYTSNLEVRLQKHQEGGVKSTAGRRPLMLIFTEYYLFKEDALKREGYFKTTMGKKAIKLMLNRTLDQLGHKKATAPDFLFEEE
jgi:putative endonuclease